MLLVAGATGFLKNLGRDVLRRGVHGGQTEVGREGAPGRVEFQHDDRCSDGLRDLADQQAYGARADNDGELTGREARASYVMYGDRGRLDECRVIERQTIG